MVGGLADWFAVTALFRHPLGLPIPHTAIIPRNKDRIGDNLASFLQTNFLTPSVVARRLDSVDMAGALGRWLASPPADGRLRRGFAKLIAEMLAALDDQAIATLVKGAAAKRLRGLFRRSEEHTSALQSLMRNSYAVFFFQKKHNYYRSYI